MTRAVWAGGSPRARPDAASESPIAPLLRVQRACACGSEPTRGGSCEACQDKRVARKAAPAHEQALAPSGGEAAELLAGLGAGQSFDGAARARMEQALGHDFRSIRLHADASADRAARDLGAHAFAIGDHVGFASGMYAPGTLEGDALLAHELAHTLQQQGGAAGPGVADERLEADADLAAAGAVASLYAGAEPAAAPSQRAPANKLSLSRCGRRPEAREAPLTHDAAMVARARRMLPIVRSHIAEIEGRRLQRQLLLHHRGVIEDPVAAAQRRPEQEAAGIRAMNRAPLRIELTGDAVVFHARFQVRFEDPSHAHLLGTIRDAVQRGADLVWTSPEGEVIPGRRFEMRTEVEAEGTARDSNHWLIVVRPGEQAPVQHPGCSLDDPRPVVAAVTGMDCDGGVINIPPSMAGNAGVLGHEILHLFGLVDRYLLVTRTPPPSTAPQPPGSPPRPPPTPTVSTVPMRRPGEGRRDPLGAEDGPILREDLAFIFDNLGVFEADEAAFVRRIGMDLHRLRRLEDWCVETIRLGRDASRLFQPRQDFRDRMFRDAERL